MNESVNNVIIKFQQAIAKRDTETLGSILHPDFRVIANRFKGEERTVLLSKDVYLGMMKEEKIGGTLYEIKIINISTFEYSAMVEFNLISNDSSGMHVYFLLVQNSKDDWQIISDLPIVVSM